MANREHLKILQQGVNAWLQWRIQNKRIKPDLAGAHLRKVDLSGVDFGATNLSDADLSYARLDYADLSKANLSRAFLPAAILMRTNLTRANLYEATFGETVFTDVDLSTIQYIESCTHSAPSVLDHRTLMQSGRLPEVFLRGCGLPDNWIEYLPSLLNEPVKFYSCFISYSSKDEEFAKRLHADLQNSGVRCWFAPEDMKIGDKIRPVIDESIRVYDKLLLILIRQAHQPHRAVDQKRVGGKGVPELVEGSRNCI